jgi:hypothetical protein
MRAVQHWHLFCLATTWWTLFFILGLPSDYFQTTPIWLIILFGEIAPAIALCYFVWRRCSRTQSRAETWQRAAWIAFYMTVPLFIYDYLYLAIHQSRGWSFLLSHWYLTAFYVIPWVLSPIIVAWQLALPGGRFQTKVP